MPGSNTRALDKARTLPVDGVIMDLEDAVAPEAKTAARDQVLAAITAGGYNHRELVIRVNGAGTAWGKDDLAAAATSGADAVLLPKVEGPQQLDEAVAQLIGYGAPDTLNIWVMAETAAGILAIDEIAAATSRLAVIVMGTADLSKQLRIKSTPGRLGLLAALSRCVLAARAQGLDILDGVHTDLSDAGSFKNTCEQGKALGFDGKTLIHPRQIEMANRVFGVTEAEVAQAAEVIDAWNAATADGRGIAVLNGQMIEKLHAHDARRVLALHTAIERTERR
jgi:citrate lyase subunit beta/citryl-CoA lyase